MAELLGEAVVDQINRLVEIVAMVLGVNVRPGQSEVDFDDEGVLEGAFVVVPECDVGADQIQPEMLEAFNFLGDIGMNRRSQLYIARTDMDLHSKSRYIRLLLLSKA